MLEHARVHMWRSEDNFKESACFFHYVNSGEQTQVARFASDCLYILSHLLTDDAKGDKIRAALIFFFF